MSFLTNLKELANANFDAGKTAVKQDAGKVLNDRATALVSKAIGNKNPLVSMFLKTAWGQWIVANMVAVLVIQFLPTNRKALIAADLMVQGATRDIADEVNLPGMVNQFLATVNDVIEDDTEPTAGPVHYTPEEPAATTQGGE